MKPSRTGEPSYALAYDALASNKNQFTSTGWQSQHFFSVISARACHQVINHKDLAIKKKLCPRTNPHRPRTFVDNKPRIGFIR